MLNCRDPALTALRDKGYNVVLVPKADLTPTQLLVRAPRLRRLGDLTSVFSPGEHVATPPVSRDNPGPTISGTKSADLKLGIGLKILSGLIAGLGGSTLGINVGYQKASSIQFEFTDTKEDNAQPALIDQFLADADVNPYARAVNDMLEADDVYILTSTLKAASISVQAKREDGASLEVELPVVQNAVGANVKVEGSGKGDGKVVYKGTTPLVFAFQAVRLIFDKGEYRTMRVTDAGAVALESMKAQAIKESERVYLALNGFAGEL